MHIQETRPIADFTTEVLCPDFGGIATIRQIGRYIYRPQSVGVKRIYKVQSISFAPNICYDIFCQETSTFMVNVVPPSTGFGTSSTEVIVGTAVE